MRRTGTTSSLLNMLEPQPRERANAPSLLTMLDDEASTPQPQTPMAEPTPPAAPVAAAATEPAPATIEGAEALERLERALHEARRLREGEAPSAVYEPPVAKAEPAPTAPVSAAPLPVSVPRAPAAAPSRALPQVEPTGSAASSLGPAAIIRTLVRRWYLIVLGGLAGAAVAALYSLTLPNEYQAISRIVLEPRGITAIRDTVSPQGLNSEATIAYSQSQVDIISSVSVLSPVIENEDLLNDREFVETTHLLDKIGLDGLRRALFADETAKPNEGEILEQIYERLYVGRLNQSFVIEIGFTSEDPAKAARIANSITRSYLQSESGAQSEAAQSASTDLTSRLDALRAKVAASEELIEAHKREFGLVETNGRLVDEDSLSRLNDQLARATAQTAEARSQVELARTVDVEDAVGGGLPSALQTQAMAQARLQHQRARAAVNRLSVKLGERHPQLREAAAELTAAEESVRAELRRILGASERELSRAQSREADLLESVTKLRESTLQSNAPKATLRELERQLDADRQVYENFLRRSRETSEQTGIATRNARIISEALPPEKKVGPLRTLMTAGGGVVGAGLGGLLALFPLLFGAGRSFLRGSASPAVRSERTVQSEPNVADDLYGDGPAVVATPGAPATPHVALRAVEPAPKVASEEATAEPKVVPSPSVKSKAKPKKRKKQPKAKREAEIVARPVVEPVAEPEVIVPVPTPALAADAQPAEPDHEASFRKGLEVAREEARILAVAREEAEQLRAEAEALREKARADAESRQREAAVQHAPQPVMAPPMHPPAYPAWPQPPVPYGYAPPAWPYPQPQPPAPTAAPEPQLQAHPWPQMPPARGRADERSS